MAVRRKAYREALRRRRIVAAMLACCTALFAVAAGFHHHALAGPSPETTSFEQPWKKPAAAPEQCLACRLGQQNTPELASCAEVERPTLESGLLPTGPCQPPLQAGNLDHTPRAPPAA